MKAADITRPQAPHLQQFNPKIFSQEKQSQESRTNQQQESQLILENQNSQKDFNEEIHWKRCGWKDMIDYVEKHRRLYRHSDGYHD